MTQCDPREAVDGVILSFNLENGDAGDFRTEFTRFPYIDVGTNGANTPHQIGQTDPLANGFPEIHDLGDVFPPGMSTVAELSEYLTVADHAAGLGAGGELDLIVVPEPNALCHVILLCALGWPLRRRIRRQAN